MSNPPPPHPKMATTPPQPPSLHQKALQTASYIEEKITTHFCQDTVPHLAIIAGSGLSVLAQALENTIEIPYGQLDGFPVGVTSGHASTLICGTIRDTTTPALLMNGRAHFYEGHSFQDATFPIRVLKLLGVEICIITNAAGSLNKRYKVGDIVIINDHINLAGLAGLSPLRGPNIDEFGPRFLALSDAYDLDLRRKAHLAWARCGQTHKLEEGVYTFAAGPCYETRAETRMLSMLGGDLVGMSTIPEVIVARHAGMRVFGVSIVTNTAVHDPTPLGSDPEVLTHITNKAMEVGGVNHAEVLAATRTVADDVKDLIVELIGLIDSDK